ncbi:MAG: hypothetical protein ACT6R2_15810, partial [Blastomonas fulva]|uniref:hypothetical protein n=1 Tax=Blastomonas fulva TaxID=1550728 RepID=UPI004033E2CF
MRIGTLTLAALLAAIPLSAAAEARTLDPAKPEDALEIMKRTQCGVKDNVPAVYRWAGKIF